MKKIFTLLALGFAGTLQAQVTSPSPYCNGEFDDPAPVVPDAIKSITLGTLTNASGGQYAAPHYVYYSNLAAPDLTAGTSMPMSVTFNAASGCGWGVWIDFNQNNTFEASEKVAGSTGTGYLSVGSNTMVSPAIAIPATATSGNTRMRVRIVEDNAYTMVNGTAILPCNASTSAADVMDWGETEDYKVNIVNGTGGGGTGGGSGTGTPPPNPNGLDFSSNRILGFTTTNFTLSDNSYKNPTARHWIFTPNKVIYQAATTAGSARPIVRFTDTGTYSVKLVTTFAGGKDSAERVDYIRITPVTSGIANVGETPFAIFPNPARNEVNFATPLYNATVVITSVTGAVAYQNALFSGTKIDVRNLTEGVYFLRFTQTGETVTQKFLLAK